MKNILFATLLIPFFAFGQNLEEETKTNYGVTRKHEFRIDAAELVSIPNLEINYEYIINKNAGAGAAVSFLLGSNDFEMLQNFAFTPYYRQYFFNKKDYGGRGFFAEANMRLATGTSEIGSYINDVYVDNQKDWTQFGFGFSIGQKWVNTNGFSLELSIGGGRYLGNQSEEGDIPAGFFRGGILVGYRFF